MGEWFGIVIRQSVLYSFPLLFTFSAIAMAEYYLLRKTQLPRLNLFSLPALLPLAASILFGRAIIFALPQHGGQGVASALLRLAVHLFLCLLGWLLYTWALAHPPLTGLPPLHHWWAKVLMYLNLCLAALHLLPIPTMLLGECCLLLKPLQPLLPMLRGHTYVTTMALTIVAASPLLDIFLGGSVVFPLYAYLFSLAT